MSNIIKFKGSDLTGRQRDIQSAFINNYVIIHRCHEILNSVTDLSGKSYSSNLGTSLDDAKSTADKWIKSLGAKIGSAVPHYIVDYGTTFSASVDAMNQLYSADPKASGKDNSTIQSVLQIVEALIEEVERVAGNINDNNSEITSWADDVRDVANNLSNNRETLLRDIRNIENKVEDLSVKISQQKQDIVSSVLTSPVSSALSKIAGDFEKIAQERREISSMINSKEADKVYLTLLEFFSNDVDGCSGDTSKLHDSLFDLRKLFVGYGNEMQGVVDKLRAGSSLKSIMENGPFTKDTQSEWQSDVNLAQSLLTVAPTITRALTTNS